MANSMTEYGKRDIMLYRFVRVFVSLVVLPSTVVDCEHEQERAFHFSGSYSVFHVLLIRISLL